MGEELFTKDLTGDYVGIGAQVTVRDRYLTVVTPLEDSPAFKSGVLPDDKIIEIDQSPIGRTPRSNPVTYTGAFQPIRDWFAGLPEAKLTRLCGGAFQL